MSSNGVAEVNNDEVLERMHRLHLILADEVKRICEKNDIKYFMIAGTLLGAVRHKGFIPWDDDMDFGMLRPDFERFLKVCDEELNSKTFFLQTDRNDKYYTFNFAKLRLNGTRVIEDFSCNISVNQGIYIDIFPIDAVSDNRIEKAIQYKSFWLYRNLLWIKCGYGSDSRKKELSYRIANTVSKLFSIEFLKRKKMKCITKYMDKKTQYVVTSDGNYGLKKETLKADWVLHTKDYSFEDRVYPGIEDYDQYLSYFYGDYMKLPPKEKRNHHGRLKVDFGKYEGI